MAGLTLCLPSCPAQAPVDRNMLEDSACNLRKEPQGVPPKLKGSQGDPSKLDPNSYKSLHRDKALSHSTYSLESSFRRKPSRSYSEKAKQKMSLKASHRCHCGLHSQIYTMGTGSAWERIHNSNASKNRNKHICYKQFSHIMSTESEEPGSEVAIFQVFLAIQSYVNSELLSGIDMVETEIWSIRDWTLKRSDAIFDS